MSTEYENEMQRLRKAVRDAIELADEGWAYADDYFRVKWRVEEERAAILAVLNEGKGSVA